MEEITLSKDVLKALLFHSYVSGFRCGCNPFAQNEWKDRAELTINALTTDAKNSENKDE
jgi:hypothetical protein